MYSVHHEIAAQWKHIWTCYYNNNYAHHNYHCSSIIRSRDCFELLLTSCVPVNNIVLEYKTKSTNHIWSLIFFPSMSTVCILKSIPFKFETKGDMVIFETEFNTRPRGGFWPQTFRHSLNIYFTSSMTLHHTLPHLCICMCLCVAQHCVRSLKQGSPVLRTRNGTYRKICNGQTLTTLPANLCCVYHIALWTCLHIWERERERERERRGERKKEREKKRERVCACECVW